MKSALLRLFICGLLLSSCTQSSDKADENAEGEITPEWTGTPFSEALAAHGGLDAWRSFSALEFEMESGGAIEQHVVDLDTRTVRVSGDGWTLGYDGRNVWVDPNLDAFDGNPMFYSSLHFYFFSLPFVLADPGTVHRSLGMQTVAGRTFDVHEVGFEDGVGGSSNDVYRLHLNPESGRLDLLLYTATFYSGEPSNRWGAREYTWQEVDGLYVPASYTPRAWNSADSTLGDARQTATFRNVQFRDERPDSALFIAPAGAERYLPES